MQKHINFESKYFFIFKDFYKPTKQKVILAILIMVFNIAVGIYGIASNFCIENFDGHHINDCPEPNTFDNISLLFAIPLITFFSGFSFGISSNIFLSIFSTLAGILILILFWYTLSCGIVKIKSKYNSK